ncbi:MAG: hydrogenase maturation protease [Candidatus Korobacteraceae bacterium]|jgi:hydrogenase maturation protease
MTVGQSGIVIIGVGNEYRSDDGAGIAVARRLRALFPTGVTILEESGEGAALMQAWQGATWVMLVDAVRSGASPGTIHRLDARAAPMPAGFFHYSTHAFSVAEAVELARSLDQLPPHLVVYGIEGANFAACVELSPAVEQAVEAVVERLAQEVTSAL